MDEEDADSALKGLMGRWYAGRPIMCEFSPVTDFREARCRQFDEGTCNRRGLIGCLVGPFVGVLPGTLLVVR